MYPNGYFKKFTVLFRLQLYQAIDYYKNYYADKSCSIKV